MEDALDKKEEKFRKEGVIYKNTPRKDVLTLRQMADDNWSVEEIHEHTALSKNFIVQYLRKNL